MTTNSLLMYLASLSFFFFLSAPPLCRAFASGRNFNFSLDDAGVTGPTPGGMCAYAVTIYGFQCQEYSVTTDDGYILGVQRIPVGRQGGGGTVQRQPVLLQHGLLADGKCWLENSPEQSLAMILADSGFDVWISNFRGTRFSRRHVALNPAFPEFWNWSWDELANHDVLSVIDFIFKETGKQIHYVGHSLGTTVAFALMSRDKFANVKSAALLSPIAYLSHTTSILAKEGAANFLGDFGASMGAGGEFNPNGPTGTNFLKLLCSNPMVDCPGQFNAFSGNDCCLEKTVITNYMSNDLQATSFKNMVHFAQDIRTGIMANYDYENPIQNFQNYGAAFPPIYDLSKIAPDFPLFMGYGGQDALSDSTDIAILLNNLKGHQQDKLQVVLIPQYAHVDCIMATDAKDLLYNHVVEFFQKYN